MSVCRRDPMSARLLRRQSPTGGFSLIEMLVALVVASTVLAAGWPFVFAAATVARSGDDRAQADAAGRAALRRLAIDLEAATAVEPSLAGSGALTIESAATADQPSARRTVMWDESRQILWRGAPGSYLADHVTRFVVICLDPHGDRLAGGQSGLTRQTTAAIVIAIEITHGRQSVSRQAVMPVGAP